MKPVSDCIVFNSCKILNPCMSLNRTQEVNWCSLPFTQFFRFFFPLCLLGAGGVFRRFLGNSTQGLHVLGVLLWAVPRHFVGVHVPVVAVSRRVVADFLPSARDCCRKKHSTWFNYFIELANVKAGLSHYRFPRLSKHKQRNFTEHT